MKLEYTHWQGSQRSVEVVPRRRGGRDRLYSNGRTIFWVSPFTNRVFNAGSEFAGLGTFIEIGTDARLVD